MFVFSVKASKRQIASMVLCVVMLIVVLLVAIFWPSGDGDNPAQTGVSIRGGDDVERVSFLRELGYEVVETPVSVKEVLIPDELDDVLLEYNELQKQAGMDLEQYHGKRVKVWTYRVLGAIDEDVQASLYVYKDKIIGGDVHSTALDGFMRGLVKNTEKA